MAIDRQDVDSPAQGGVTNERNVTDRVWAILEGGLIARFFTRRALLWIFAILLFSLFQVYNRYEGMRKIKKIEAKERELIDLRMNHVTINATLMGEQRFSSIESRLKEQGIELSTPKNPPVVVEK